MGLLETVLFGTAAAPVQPDRTLPYMFAFFSFLLFQSPGYLCVLRQKAAKCAGFKVTDMCIKGSDSLL